MLRERILTALVLLALLIPAVAAGNLLWFELLTALMIGAGGWEWGRLCGLGQGVSVASGVALALACGVIGPAYGLEMPAEHSYQVEEDRARVVAAEAAIAEVERVQHKLAAGRKDADVYIAAAGRVMDFYRSRIEIRSRKGEAGIRVRESEDAEQKMRMAAVKAERRAIFKMLRSQQIGSEIAGKLVRELDLLETRYEA